MAPLSAALYRGIIFEAIISGDSVFSINIMLLKEDALSQIIRIKSNTHIGACFGDVYTSCHAKFVAPSGQRSLPILRNVTPQNAYNILHKLQHSSQLCRLNAT